MTMLNLHSHFLFLLQKGEIMQCLVNTDYKGNHEPLISELYQ